MFVDDKGNSLTNREIMDVFIYGYYAHTNSKHEATIAQWESDPKVFHSFKLLFLVSLQLVFKTAIRIRDNILKLP
jgi:hypothetical protein